MKAKNVAELIALGCAIALSVPSRNIANTSNEIPVNGPQPSTNLHRLDDAVKTLIKRWNVPGAAVAICKDGKVLFSRGYGFADIEAEAPVLPEKSLFRIASVSKCITAAAVMKLAEDDKLKIDDEALQIIGNVPPPTHYDKRLGTIRVRDLLQMSGGWDKERSGDPVLQPYIFLASKRLHKAGPADFDSTMQYVLGHRLDFSPGSRFSYSNFEYGLLGKVVEHASHCDYETFVRKSFFEPAGVQLYKAHTRLEDRLPNEVIYYAPLEPSARPLLPTGRKRVPAPYGRAYMESDLPMFGWVATAPELASLIDKLTTDNAFLREDTRKAMLARPSLPCWKDTKQYFAFGWEVRKDAHNRLTMYKDGTLPGTRAFVEHTADGITWVALFNARPLQKQPDKFAHQVREVMASGLDYIEVAKEPTNEQACANTPADTQAVKAP